MPVPRKVPAMVMLALIALFAPMKGSAATLIHLTLDEMTAQSQAILLGRCVEVSSAWNATHTDIVTSSVFEVAQYYKGSLGKRVTITELGGQVGGWVSEYPGIPRFRVGEESLLFVWTGPDGAHQVIGLTQGKFRVQRSAGGGDVQLNQTPPSEAMLEPPGHSHAVAVAPVALPLRAFQDRVQSMLAKPAGGAR